MAFCSFETDAFVRHDAGMFCNGILGMEGLWFVALGHQRRLCEALLLVMSLMRPQPGYNESQVH
jgi:hypothetical protein